MEENNEGCVGNLSNPAEEKKQGKHPTQKPEKLLTMFIESSTNIGNAILDPFNSSGTTGVVSKK